MRTILTRKLVRKQDEPSRRGRVYAIAFLSLLGFFGGAAAEELKIGGSGAGLGTMRLLGNEFTAANPDVTISLSLLQAPVLRGRRTVQPGR
ncbi:protein of unknown function [Georgfuchsia toluolica]|uniref:Uncharacterized protein n=1 Tax=Georgfuchsia toluolica TaxID=424218 RepID=A0A916J618_9PROT|nr:protein of unknown function [Georgfuchsia toluolica]